MSGIVLSLCDRTGNMVRPWMEAGYQAHTLDIQAAMDEPSRTHTQCDIRRWFPIRCSFVAVFAFPPCTHLASSGARWWKDKGLVPLIEALEVFEACRRICEESGVPWMIENPVGSINTITEMYWRGPDQSFNPHDYGDPYTKKTMLWTGGGFVMPPVIRPGDMFEAATWVEPSEGSRMHTMSPSAARADLRSATPMGFSDAVFRANAPHLKEVR